jgi:cobalt/nickel transport system permease protein
MVLTPLGILAAGSAWGEWAPEDFSSPSARQQIAAASGKVLPPASAPVGLQRLASLWTAPMPRYAPPFLKSAAFGYLLSAVFGTGLIACASLLAGWFLGGRTGCGRAG